MNARYLPLLRLASGKDADVYLGVLRSVQGYGRPVVMKRAFAGLRGDEAKARERLVEEADAALRLRHPHVVGALELAELPEGLVLVYDYVGGLSLYGLVRHLARDRATVPDAYVCQIVADAAAGLAYSHRVLGRGHGDLSSRNVLISDEAFGRVIDFAPAHDRLTPHYASPERARGGPPTEASDVYSLGLLAYLLRTGAPAFNAPTSKATLEAIKPWLSNPGDLPEKLFIKAVAELMLAEESKEKDAYLDAGLTFMRIVIHFERAGQSHPLVAPARLEVGYIHKQIGRED
ncbi:MAG: protein kinase, partial [Myxococcota bacterium]